MNSKMRGNIGEAAVAQDLLRRGYPVFTELGDSCKTDLIALVDEKPIKIQVKCISETPNGTIQLALFKSGPGHGYVYTPRDCDVFAVYNLERDIVSYIGWHHIRSEIGLKIRYESTKNGQTKGIRMHTEFTDFLQALIPE